MLRERNYDPQRWFKVIYMYVESCVIIFPKYKLIFGEAIFELSAILFHHNVLFFEIIT